jgi:hypothetical protein
MHYRNEHVLLASKHEKERVIRPIFHDKIGCTLYTSDFDTDQFGTFTGEIPRIQNAYQTCILKARAAAIAADCFFSIASEGSFGAHPAIPFLASDHEIMEGIIHISRKTGYTHFNLLQCLRGTWIWFCIHNRTAIVQSMWRPYINTSI